MCKYLFLQVFAAHCHFGLQQGELEMRKPRASRCQRQCGSRVGILCCPEPSLFMGEGVGDGHREQVIGRQTVQAEGKVEMPRGLSLPRH